MRRKLERGKAFEELVKGSLDYAMAQIRTSFYRQFRPTTDSDYAIRFWIEEIFVDYVIVRAPDLPPDEFYYVPFTQDDAGAITFVARDSWEVVELVYRIAAGPESVSPGTTRTEALEPRPIVLVEALGNASVFTDAETGRRRVRAIGITANEVNGNNRIYPLEVLEAAVKEARERLYSLGARAVLGEAEHPGDKPTKRANFLETVVRWDSIELQSGKVVLEGTLIPTSKGQDAITLMEFGVMPGISQRGWGYAELETVNGSRVERITEIHIDGYDLVLEPADKNGAILALESQQQREERPHTQEANNVDELTLEQLRARYPELVAQILAEGDRSRRAALEEALRLRAEEDSRVEARVQAERERIEREVQERIQAADNARQAAEQQAATLQEAEQRRQVQDHIAAEAARLTNYSQAMRQQLVEAVNEAAPASIDEANTELNRARRLMDAAIAGRQLAAQGFPVNGQGATSPAGQIQIVGPVIENETGQPAFAAVSIALCEGLQQRGLQRAHNLRDMVRATVNERYAIRMLQRFDSLYGHYLQEEARRWEEASQVADLNLPYSVARTIVAQVFPELIAASIFDLDTTDQAPTRVYYETFQAETGLVVIVTDEVVTASNPLGSWVDLANKRPIPGTIVVTNAAGTTTYTEGTDYVIDHIEGKIMALATGTITAGQSLKVDYQYEAIRKGERQGIERGKQLLDYKTLEIAADRIAGEISREAVVFSRAQLGYDATQRMLDGIVTRTRRTIDKGIMMRGLSAALMVANNIGGTWTAATDSIDKLAEHTGKARVKLENRYYMAQWLLVSRTNGDRMSNWSGFTAAGQRPDADINATGYVGRFKGLPVFESTEFVDTYALIGHRELVQHRVFQPMVLRGPYPTYDANGKLVASDQYYTEEFNGTDSPVPQKGSLVKIA